MFSIAALPVWDHYGIKRSTYNWIKLYLTNHTQQVLAVGATSEIMNSSRPITISVVSQLIRFARASSHVADFNSRNKLLTQKLHKQGYRYHKIRKTFSKFYRQYYDLISKFQIGLKSLLRQGLSEPEFYGDLVY